jgi:hypothetical protein
MEGGGKVQTVVKYSNHKWIIAKETVKEAVKTNNTNDADPLESLREFCKDTR